jgi:hypothetical protein
VTNATGPSTGEANTLFHEELIDVTPQPVFSRLEGFDDRVVGCMEVLGCVLVLGAVTAANMAARFA